MDINSWNRLTTEQQKAVKSMSSKFIKAVFASPARDGFDLSSQFKVVQRGEQFYVSNGIIDLGDLHHHDAEVMNALLGSAIQNYGR